MINAPLFMAGAALCVALYSLGRYHGARAALRRISEHNQRVAYHQQAAAGPDTEREA